jgi:outer membrane receptor for ferrienterochelin and colicins
MKQLIISIVALCAINLLYAQHSFTALVKSSKEKKPLQGATISIKKQGITAIADSNGLVTIHNLPAGTQLLVFSHISHSDKMVEYRFPLSQQGPAEIYLDEKEEEEEEVIVTSTRTSRTIANTPTRVETINGEELDEKNNMRPANVSMLLHESTGLQVQQTSATTGNAGIRMQGLDGRYTQLLKNGYPNFGNFAGGLSILEIPPLDLKQVEIIKGPASTLYGGGAIAGVINFVTKTPKEEAVYEFMLNRSNIGQSNIGAFAAHKKGKMGYTLLTALNWQQAYDVDRDDFSEVPKGHNFTISPSLFFYPDAGTIIMLSNSLTKSNSMGGDIQVIGGKADAYHVYFEKNKTTRNTTVLELEKQLHNGSVIKLKQSYSIFNRDISTPGYTFSGLNRNSFTDLSWLRKGKQHVFISGINILYDQFRQQSTGLQNARSFTTGLYMQDTWDITEKVILESGIRFDNATYRTANYRKNQFFVLPRVSALFKFSEKINSRIGGGLGYKTPSIFTEQTEALQYRDILPLSNVTAERSAGITADVDYKTTIAGVLSFSINQLFFYTAISNPLVLQPGLPGTFYFANAARPVNSRGIETNLKFIYKNDLKLFVGYTHTIARANYQPVNKVIPLQPKNKLNLTLMYEKEDNFKLGLEAYLTGNQYLYNNTKTPSFWELGFMAQKTFKKVSFFINFENFTDQRQSRYKTVANAPHSNPGFDDIWNHTEGFICNGGIKIKL